MRALMLKCPPGWKDCGSHFERTNGDVVLTMPAVSVMYDAAEMEMLGSYEGSSRVTTFDAEVMRVRDAAIAKRNWLVARGEL